MMKGVEDGEGMVNYEGTRSISLYPFIIPLIPHLSRHHRITICSFFSIHQEGFGRSVPRQRLSSHVLRRVTVCEFALGRASLLLSSPTGNSILSVQSRHSLFVLSWRSRRNCHTYTKH